MYPRVPTTFLVEACVTPKSTMVADPTPFRTVPKSATLATPAASRITFAVFKSLFQNRSMSVRVRR